MLTVNRFINETRKTLITIVGLLTAILATGLVQGQLFTRLTLVLTLIGAVTSALVYAVRNDTRTVTPIDTTGAYTPIVPVRAPVIPAPAPVTTSGMLPPLNVALPAQPSDPPKG